MSRKSEVQEITQEDELTADAIENALHERGGAMQAHLLPIVLPGLRRTLLDQPLVRFIEKFPERFSVHRGASNHHLAEVRALRCMSQQRNDSPAVKAPLAQEHAIHAARELADAILNAIRRFPEKGAALWKAGAGSREDVETPDWVPISWLVREKAVNKRLQAHVLHCPVLELLHCKNPEVVAILGDKGALWATQATHLRHFLETWTPKVGPIMPQLRERHEVACSIEKKGAAGKLLAAGYTCPCRIEVAIPPDSNDYAFDDAGAASALLQRVVDHLKHKCLPVHAVGLDFGVHASFRQCRAAGQLGLLRWLQGQPTLKVFLDPAGKWCVSAIDAGGDRYSWNGSSGSNSEDGDANASTMTDAVQVIATGAGVLAFGKPVGCSTERVLAQHRARLMNAGDPRMLISVSRLDRETSGVLIAAFGSVASAEALKVQYAGKEVFKEYVCLCSGSYLGPVGYKGEVKCKLKVGKVRHRVAPSPAGKEACTRFEVVDVFSPEQAATTTDNINLAHLLHDELSSALRCRVAAQASNSVAAQASNDKPRLSLLRVWPLTGRTHQIRVHMQSLGCPLVGDHKYGQRAQLRNQRKWCPRLFLHCLHVRLRDEEGHDFEAMEPLPSDLGSVLDYLRGGWSAAD